MSDGIVFYLYQDKTELCGETFPAGALTADLLNLSPEDYAPMHESIENITRLENTFEKTGEISLWLELNENLSMLSQSLRRYTVFTFLLKEDDTVFSAVRAAGLREHPAILEKSKPISEEEKKRATECGRQLLSLNFVDEVPERILPYEPAEPVRIEKYIDSEWLFANGFSRFAWAFYKKMIARYRSYLHDVRAFNGTIRNFIKFALSRLRHNNPENYAEALYAFYTDERTTKKLIVNPIYCSGDCYRTYDSCRIAYVPRLLPGGSAVISQEQRTHSLQALLKADYMHALNCGYNIHRCLVCGRYFLLKSGAHTLYCENACPYDSRFTCRQFGTVKVKKELARDGPKIRVWSKAYDRITKDMQRGNITRQEAHRAKIYVRDLLYDAMRDPKKSVEQFEKDLASSRIYNSCCIERKKRMRGRPPKAKTGDAP